MTLRVVNQALLIEFSEYSSEMESFDSLISRGLQAIKNNEKRNFSREVNEDFLEMYNDSIYREIEIDDELCLSIEGLKINNETFNMTLYRVLRELSIPQEHGSSYLKEHENCKVAGCSCKIIQWPKNKN